MMFVVAQARIAQVEINVLMSFHVLMFHVLLFSVLNLLLGDLNLWP